MTGILKNWSATAASNTTAATGIAVDNGTLFGSDHGAARSIMAAVKALANQLTGAKTTGGSANAQTFTSDTAGAIATAYAAGMAFLFRAGYSNTAACTLNVDGVGAKTIKKGGALSDLVADDIVAGGLYLAVYQVTGDCFVLLNPEKGQVATGFQPLDATLTAIAALTVANGDLIKATGSDTFTTLNASSDAQTLLGHTFAQMRSDLSLGTAALKNIGTTGNNVPVMDAVNSWTANQAFTTLTAFGSTTMSNLSLHYGTGDSTSWKYGPSTNTSNVWYVVNSSNVGAYLTSGSGSWTSTSDERAKNIHDALSDDDALSAICALTPVFYDWKHDETHKLRVGLIAQQTLPVLPYAVDQPANPDLMMGIQYGGDAMIAHLIGAIRKLAARIEQLEAA